MSFKYIFVQVPYVHIISNFLNPITYMSCIFVKFQINTSTVTWFAQLPSKTSGLTKNWQKVVFPD